MHFENLSVNNSPFLKTYYLLSPEIITKKWQYKYFKLHYPVMWCPQLFTNCPCVNSYCLIKLNHLFFLIRQSHIWLHFGERLYCITLILFKVYYLSDIECALFSMEANLLPGKIFTMFSLIQHKIIMVCYSMGIYIKNNYKVLFLSEFLE